MHCNLRLIAKDYRPEPSVEGANDIFAVRPRIFPLMQSSMQCEVIFPPTFITVELMSSGDIQFPSFQTFGINIMQAVS